MPAPILIVDFGSQYTQLIARRVRELNVYCEIHPFHKIPPVTDRVKGVILSGGPRSVREATYPDVDLSVFQDIPVLAVCYGAQLMVHRDGGEVGASQLREYGKAVLTVSDVGDLFRETAANTQVWMSHADTIVSLPKGYERIAGTESVEIAAFRHASKNWYGLQFHPEVTHTAEGKKIIQNFVTAICRCAQDWTPDRFVDTTIKTLAEKLGDDKVVMALSGGVDSTVAATLIHRAIGKKLYGIFVDNGLLRKGEFEQVMASYRSMGLNVKGVDAKDRFYAALKGLTDPEAKRKAVGRTFVEVFEEEAKGLSDTPWLGQGTIYPDVIESVSVKGPSAVIKSHHNVGGLPDTMKMSVVEPLNTLFKDEVRRVGSALKITPDILKRHPFPGPGLSLRVLGEVTPEKISMLQEVDAIFIAHLHRFDLYDKVWQAAVILLSAQSVGVMGDQRTYESVVALRAVTSVDGMTADWARLPDHFLNDVSSSIINNVRGVNRVVYDISSKPPATIEWE